MPDTETANALKFGTKIKWETPAALFCCKLVGIGKSYGTTPDLLRSEIFEFERDDLVRDYCTHDLQMLLEFFSTSLRITSSARGGN
jgi:hypothetical protein